MMRDSQRRQPSEDSLCRVGRIHAASERKTAVRKVSVFREWKQMFRLNSAPSGKRPGVGKNICKNTSLCKEICSRWFRFHPMQNLICILAFTERVKISYPARSEPALRARGVPPVYPIFDLDQAGIGSREWIC
jgi:hypothetical protein